MKCPKCGYELPKAMMRSGQQNNLQWLWAKDAAEQLNEYSVEEEQRQCKFLYGLPILKRKEKFIEKWNKIISQGTSEEMLYENQVELMEFIPISSVMTKKEMQEYLDTCYQHYSGRGVELTEPSEVKYGKSN